MAFLKWTDELSVGVALVDEQHHKLVDMTNELHTAMKAHEGRGAVGKIFLGLADYTAIHFKTEEDLMVQHQYLSFQEHKKEHDDLIQQVQALRLRAEKNDLALTIDLMMFLKDWLVNHIMGTDKKMGEFLRGKA